MNSAGLQPSPSLDHGFPLDSKTLLYCLLDSDLYQSHLYAPIGFLFPLFYPIWTHELMLPASYGLIMTDTAQQGLPLVKTEETVCMGPFCSCNTILSSEGPTVQHHLEGKGRKSFKARLVFLLGCRSSLWGAHQKGRAPRISSTVGGNLAACQEEMHSMEGAMGKGGSDQPWRAQPWCQACGRCRWGAGGQWEHRAHLPSSSLCSLPFIHPSFQHSFSDQLVLFFLSPFGLTWTCSFLSPSCYLLFFLPTFTS